jgi:hypothetical protein
MQEGVLHVELLNRLVARGSKGKHRAVVGRLHNRAENLIIVNPGALCETLNDLASLVAIENPVGEELAHEDPLAGDDVGATGPGDKLPGPIAHQGPVLFLHIRTPIQISMCGADRCQDRRRRHRRSCGGEDEPIRRQLESSLGPRDHWVRVHRRHYGHDRGRSANRCRRGRSHGRWSHGLTRSTNVGDRRSQSHTRWRTSAGHGRRHRGRRCCGWPPDSRTTSL